MDHWLCLVEIMQNMWRTGDITQELGWNFLVIIPKGTTNTRGIVLLETLRKVGVGADRHPSMCKPLVAQRLTRVQDQKRDRDSYNGVEAHSRVRQHRPIPTLPGIPAPKEGLRHLGPITTPHKTVKILRGTLPVWTLGDLLLPPTSGAKTE